MKVLLVDDSETIRRLQKTILAAHGVDDVVEAGTEEEAIRRMGEEGVPDLVLLDWFIPGSDGLTMAKRLMADEKTKNVPIIMVTAEASKRKLAEALEAGVADCVVKPFTPAAFWETIERIAGEHGIETPGG